MSTEDKLALSQTIEARIAELLKGPDGTTLVRTLVDTPGATLRPNTAIGTGSTRGHAAVDALRDLGASLHGKIHLHKTLGEGGMGIVHLATQATVGRHVAVKTLRSGVENEDATVRILREAWVTGSLEHPNVVPVYDVGVDAAGAPIIVMKRIEGREWADLVHAHDEIKSRFGAKDPLEWNLDILGSVCNALDFAHSRGILHRDLKPENVMIGAFGEVYLLDWGIAVSLVDDPTGRLPLAAAATDVAGTPHYMAPEMLLGDPSKLSPRTDVYLLGAVLYEIVVGKPPHDGPDLRSMVAHILGSELHFPDHVPAEIRAICEKAMSRDVDRRYESAAAFRRAIEEYATHAGSRRLSAAARKSHDLLTACLARDADEARAQDMGRLLGECRFGYRAALTAWPENTEAKEGLDLALLAVVEQSLATGDTTTAEALLREVLAPPPDVARRVEAAVKARVENDARLRRMEVDQDATVGRRTRSFLVVVFGGIFTTSPLMVWEYVRRTGSEPMAFPALAPLAFLALGGVAFRWARETLTKTLYNRHLATTALVYLLAQFLLSVGGTLAGLTPYHIHVISIFGWGLTYGFLAIWAEPWFALVSVTCAVSFVLAGLFPSTIFPLMSFDNLVFTVTVVRAWLPKEEIRLLKEEGRTRFEAHRRR